MSFNIRRRMTGLVRSPDRWDRRRPFIQRMLAAELPAIVGVQEALPDQAEFVRQALGERYRSIGYGRQADKRGEGCPIMYDRDRLRLVGWTQTALSDTPEVGGSTTWGNAIPRVVLDATFADRDTGAEFRVLNTHFDHKSRTARLHSADEILTLVAGSSLPAIATGDFNTDAGTLPHDRMTAPGGLLDSWDTTGDRLTDAWGTFPNYRAPQLGRKRIDWILVSPSIEVVSAAINVAQFDGKWPSDHAPVQAVLRIPGGSDIRGGSD
ncbi:MAG: endonuclease/exonuclease/phosphatase family protein [Burkholderiaceae bacterium]|nr:endonuclease/exonuclease/phosphatase family protein [Microbacteriaceae bacterium]